MPLSFKCAKLTRFEIVYHRLKDLILASVKEEQQKKSIYPPVVRFLRGVFPLLERFFPGVARRLAIYLFLTPVRFPYKPEEKALLETYERHEGSYQGERFYYFSKGEGPTLICLHGWSGRGMQFRKMGEFFVNAGYRFVFIDAPGHGMSAGKKSNLFKFAAAFKHVLNQTDGVKAVVGHSLGAASISYSVSRGTEVPAFILLGAPTLAEDILLTFSRTINASSFVHDAIRKAAVDVFDEEFDDVAMQSTFKQVDVPTLSLHGKRDTDVSLKHQEYLKKIRPELETKQYDELGHRSILKDQQVFEDMKAWIEALE